ncbi:MAG: ComEC/Rec2 family competence protein [Candidatus Omnitrophota bacterium]
MFKNKFIAALLNFWLFLAFASGIVIAYHFPSFLIFIFLFIISAILSIFFYKKQTLLLSDVFIVILFISLGALIFLPHAYQNPDNFFNQENAYTLKVSSLPACRHSQNTFFAEISKINGIPIVLRARVVDYTRKMKYLDQYETTGRLSRRKFGNFDFYSLWIKSNAVSIELPAHIEDRITRRLTYHLLDVFKKNLTDESYRFLASVFLGRRELLERDEKSVFTDAGIAHLLAISGSNIGLTAVVLFFILKLFSVKFRVCLLISIFFLVIYTFITGSSPPTLRATIMYAVFSASFFVKRKLNPFNSLGLAGVICLLLQPTWLFDVGFQLSFLSIFALILGFKMFPIRPSRLEFLNQVQYLFFSSLYVTILITPLVAYYFGRIYILSIFNNIILIPFFTLILVANFLLIIFSPFQIIAQSIGAILSALIPIFYKLSQCLGSLKFSFINFYFSMRAVFFYYLILSVFLIAKARLSRFRISFNSTRST